MKNEARFSEKLLDINPNFEINSPFVIVKSTGDVFEKSTNTSK
jgi:hypothetical protein